MKYIKFNETGTKATEAPARIKKDTRWIFGYNSPKNEKMLLEDGYIKYDGNLPISCLTYVDGKIIENMPQIVQPDKTYTKLQILLQTNTVSQSLHLSYEYAPKLIKKELKQLEKLNFSQKQDKWLQQKR